MPTWTFYESRAHITHPGSLAIPDNAPGNAIITRCIQLLKDTAGAHARDFPGPVSNWLPVIRRRVNNVAVRKNWIKLQCRSQSGPADIDIVIAYHLLKHRGHKWCVSLGFNQSLLPDPDLSKLPNDNSYPYVGFAKELFNTIKDDMGLFGVDRWFSIDAESNLYEKETALRSRKIGELQFIGERNIEIRSTWTTVAKHYARRPIDQDGAIIPGWGMDDDEYVLVTKVSTEAGDS